MISQQHQAITWANIHPELCRHMVSLGHNVSISTMMTDSTIQAWLPIGILLHL